MMGGIAKILFFSVFIAQPLVDEGVLEPSVQNEVERALSLAPSDAPPVTGSATNDFFGTNGLSNTQIAIKLVSCQKRGGRWFIGTNDVTSVAVEVLRFVKNPEDQSIDVHTLVPESKHP